MSPNDVNKAEKLAELFKKQGYFDKLRNNILSQELGQHLDDTKEQNTSFEEAIQKRVAMVVKDFVSRDENLIFKNRGTTSALLEAQIIKDNYKKLGEGDDGIDIERIIQKSLQSPDTINEIKNTLNKLADELGD